MEACRCCSFAIGARGGADRVKRAAAVDGARDRRVAASAEGQRANNRVQVAADNQRLPAVDGPRLRCADRDRRVDRNAFVGGNAAGGDRQRAAGKRVSSRPGANDQSVRDHRPAQRDARSAGGVERGGGFLILPSVNGKRISILIDPRPIVPTARPTCPSRPSTSRWPCASVVHGAGDGDDVVVVFNVAVGNEVVTVVAVVARLPFSIPSYS